MPETLHARKWQRHFFSRQESLKTTWKFRIFLFTLLIIAGSVTREFWLLRIGQSLVCQEEQRVSDAILVENFDPNYLLFERAEALRQAGFASRVLVPIGTWDDPTQPSSVLQGMTEVMVRVAHLSPVEFVPIQLLEPISLNAAYQIRDFLTTAQVRSVLVVSPGFRSRRSSLIYQATLVPAGIKVSCIPVFGGRTPSNWAKTWHGIQDVTEQWLKLQYYRFCFALSGGVTYGH